MKRWPLFSSIALALAVTAGCATLDAKQREWIFQPSDRAWGGAQSTDDMQDVWIAFDSRATGKAEKLHRNFEDPPFLAREAKTEDEALAHYRRIRDEIRDFVSKLLQ